MSRTSPFWLRSFVRRWAVPALIVMSLPLVPGPAVRAADDKPEMVDDPRYKAWAKFAPGSTSTLAGQMTAQGMQMQMEMKSTLADVKPEAVKVDQELTITVMGNVQQPPKRTQTINAKAPKADVVEKGEQDVEAMGKTFHCKVIEVKRMPMGGGPGMGGGRGGPGRGGPGGPGGGGPGAGGPRGGAGGAPPPGHAGPPAAEQTRGPPPRRAPGPGGPGRRAAAGSGGTAGARSTRRAAPRRSRWSGWPGRWSRRRHGRRHAERQGDALRERRRPRRTRQDDPRQRPAAPPSGNAAEVVRG